MSTEIATSVSQPGRPVRCSVIVTTWKRPVLLEATLHALVEQSYPDFEVVVVCDGEDADVRAISREFATTPNIRWIFHPENRGLPAARNTGAREAAGDIILFLDDDVIAGTDLIAVHMQHHESASPLRHIAVWGLAREERFTPLATFVDQCLHESWKRGLAETTALLDARGPESVSENFENVVCFGLNCSIRRDLFLRYGGFDEHFRASDEEREFGMRLHRAGIEFIFEPRICLSHKNAKSLEPYFRNCWRASGVLDAYRVFDLGQRNPQIEHLVSIYQGYRLDRWRSWSTWQMSEPLIALSRLLSVAANRTQWRWIFGAWGRIAQSAEYWSGAKEAGCTLSQLAVAAGYPRCALLLHSISEPQTEEESTYYLGPSKFRRMMHYFQAAGYTTASTEQWLQNRVTKKQVLLTFDDGYDDLFEELLPLAIEHRYTPLIFLTVDQIGGSNVWDQKHGLRTRKLLTLDQIREMQRYGIQFGSHTLSHPWLPSLSDTELHREVHESKHRLEDLLGVEVTSFAYPHGGVDRRVRAAVANAGYKLAFTTEPGLNGWNDPLCQHRSELNQLTSLLEFACKLRTGRSCFTAISARIKVLEREIPTATLRGALGSIRRFVRRMVKGPPSTR